MKAVGFVDRWQTFWGRAVCIKTDCIYLPLGRAVYFFSLCNIVRCYTINFHSQDDDTQLYSSTKPDKSNQPANQLRPCLAHHKIWMTCHLPL